MSRFSYGRDYYGPAMEGSDVTTPFWTEGDQSVIYPADEQAISLTKFGLGVGAIGLLGKVNLKNGERVWDKYMGAIRTFEEYTPARLGRTFQLSHILSPTETLSRQTRYLSPTTIRELRRTPGGQAWVEHLSNVIGNDRVFSPGSRVMEEGLRFEGGKLLYGKGSDVLLEHAGVIRSPMGVTPFYQEGYARSLAGRDIGHLRSALTSPVPFENAAGERTSEIFSFVGGKSKGQRTWRGLAGWGTAAVERFNRLIRSPGELLPSSIAKYAEKVGNFLTVKPSSGLKTLGAISLKLGVGLPAAYFAYDLADWGLRKLGTPGITGMAANLITSGQRVASSIAEITGGHAYRERQEEIAPGSTDLTRLMAFPLMGLIGGATANYLRNVVKQAAFQRSGYTLSEAALIVQSEKHQMIKSLYGTEMPEFLSKALTPSTTAMVEAQNQRALGTFSGYVARRIAQSQQSGGLGGKILSVLGKVTPTKLKSIIGAGIGLGLVAPFLPGALVPSKRPEELARIQSGEQLVPIRRGRWWEMGRTPWEGGRVDRFVPNWNVRLEKNARDIGVYGEDLPAIAKFWKENFTYDIEERNYYTRPYPISGAAFENVPFVGPVLAATVGRLFKPPRLMHTEDMYNEQGQIREMPLRSGERGPIPGLGEKGAGMPLSPYGAENTISESVWRLREMVGLWGWLPGAIKENITGTEGIFDQETRLQSASEMYSLSRDFYEEEMGGMAGMNEAFRRLFPRDRRIPAWNAIPNAFQDIWWMPGPGSRSPDFKAGDPYRLIEHGEYRLPGPGYDTLHPELAGINPNDWPAIARYRMLADIAPYSEEYQEVKAHVTSMKRAGHLTKEELEEVSVIAEQVEQRKTGKNFHEYRYGERSRTEVQTILSAANEASKEDKPSGFFESILGRYWETLAHNAETPFEFLTPVSPASKFVHMRSAIEDYEKTRLYGSEMAFWQNPIRDFIRPFVESTKHTLGWNGIPAQVQERRELEDYFDALEYIKFTRLHTAAQEVGDQEAEAQFEERRRETLTGVNPYTRRYTQIFRALPRRERDYFNSFVKADLDEQKKILDMVPENEKALYIARWQMENADAIKKATTQGLLSQRQIIESQEEVKRLYEDMDTEGLPKTSDLWAEYLGTRIRGESYPDWYRRTKLLEQKLAGKALPSPDWVGWNPAVSLEDVKLKVVQNLGHPPTEYDIWPDQQRMAARRPYLDEAVRELEEPIDRSLIRARIQQVLDANNIKADMISITPLAGTESRQIDLHVEEDRETDIREIIRRKGTG